MQGTGLSPQYSELLIPYTPSLNLWSLRVVF